jgi:predicted  nucleic acid-binding Zn-ribbon protein
MTEEEKLSIKQFEAKVRQLIVRFSVLEKENAALKEEISRKNNELQVLTSQIEQSRKDYDNLKLAKMINISDSELKGAKQRITNLVRDVNKCINMLSSDKSEETSFD